MSWWKWELFGALLLALGVVVEASSSLEKLLPDFSAGLLFTGGFVAFAISAVELLLYLDSRDSFRNIGLFFQLMIWGGLTVLAYVAFSLYL